MGAVRMHAGGLDTAATPPIDHLSWVVLDHLDAELTEHPKGRIEIRRVECPQGVPQVPLPAPAVEGFTYQMVKLAICEPVSAPRSWKLPSAS